MNPYDRKAKVSKGSYRRCAMSVQVKNLQAGNFEDFEKALDENDLTLSNIWAINESSPQGNDGDLDDLLMQFVRWQNTEFLAEKRGLQGVEAAQKNSSHLLNKVEIASPFAKLGGNV